MSSPRAFLLVILTAVPLTAPACGSTDPHGDDDGDDDSAAPDAAPGELRIVAASPADGERGVRPLAELTVELTNRLDPATLTPAAVTLTLEVTLGLGTYTVEEGVPIAVAWDDATRTLDVTPRVALDVKARYRLDLVGLGDGLDGAGHQLDATLRFETLWNPTVRTVTHDAAGAIRRYTAHDAPDADDPVIEGYRIVDDAGTDGVWFTTDDVIHLRTRTARASSTELRRTDYVGPGADDEWLTPDDEPGQLHRYLLDAAGLEIQRLTYDDSGPDGVPFTDDEVIDTYVASSRDAAGRILETFEGRGAGADGAWFTPDDVGRRYAKSYDAAGRLVTATSYSQPGTDAQWHTADDVISQLDRYSVDAEGRLAWTTSADAPGPDGAWGSADDVLDTGTGYSFDADGALVRLTVYGDPGSDGVWRSADDVVIYYETYEPLARDVYRRLVQTTGAGPDGLWFTADDVATNHIEQRFDAAGVRTNMVGLATAGADGVWFTADDRVGSDLLFDPTR